MAVTIKHAKTDTIADWTQSDLDAQIAAGNYPAGTVLADIVLPSDWNDDHTVTGLGTMATQNANAVAITGGTMSGVTITGYIPTTQKGVANGVATLDSGGQIPLSQIPPLGDLNYQGTWDASSNTPTLTSSVGTKGYYYVVSVAGSTNLNGITDWQIGDWAVYNGSAWQKIDNTDLVVSVNGKTGAVVLTYGDITSGVVPVVNGGTGVTTSSGANSVVLRDANGNITTNCLFEGFTSQANGSLITLTASSVQNWVITGSGGQTIKLPDATTLPSGALFTFNNNQSSGTIVVQNNSGTTVDTLQSGAFSTVVLLNNSTAAGSWDKHNQSPANVSWSTNTLDYAGSITSATWNGNVVAYNRGGTGQSSAFVAGGVVYGSSTSALAVTPIGTSGQVLTSNGAGAPTWTTPAAGTVTSVTATTPISSTGGATPNISISQATTSTNGYLSSTDWNTFNNKQPAGSYLTTVTASSPLSGSGTAGSPLVISQATTSTSGYLSSTDWNTFNNKQVALVSGTNIKTVNSTSLLGSGDVSVGVLTVTGTAPVVSSGGANPAISMAAANGTTNGYLTSTDWTTFNSKGSGTVTSVSGTAPISVATGTTTPAISISQATTSTNGYLSSTDWNTFNNKGSGSVTTVSVVSANGLAGTVANATTTPAITLSTTITGLLKGNGTAISAATSGTDYAPATSGTSILYGNGSGGFSNVTVGTGLSFSAGTLSSTVTSGLTVTSTTSNTNYNLGFQSATSGTTTVDYINTSFTANPSTGDLTSPQVVASNGIIVSSKTVANNYSIAAGSNAMSVGPVTVATGKSVTVPSGSRWVVL